MLYKITHLTKYDYSGPITETVMELRMEPRTDERQRCHHFSLLTTPRATTTPIFDNQGNRIQHFDIPAELSSLEIRTESVVEVFPLVEDIANNADWNAIDEIRFHPEFWEFTQPGNVTYPTPLLAEFTREFGRGREISPLDLTIALNDWLFETMSYDTEATTVDSPLDEAIVNRKGVCQDFSNVLITMLRSFGIPARYVSGYLFHRTDDRSHIAADATHAWIEAYIPGCGWLGFDPTNRIRAGERHIRVAIGRDYADVPPTRGVFKGIVESTLSVAVRVSLASDEDANITPPTFTKRALANIAAKKHEYRYDDQQQQQ